MTCDEHANPKARQLRTVLILALAMNAGLVFGYRVYRLGKGGPMADVIGGAILATLLGIIAIALSLEVTWVRWFAFAYAGLFAIVVMPLWTLAVLIPLPPKATDYAFAVLYSASLVLIGVSAFFL